MPQVQHNMSAATLEALPDPHREIVSGAMRNILSTSIAEDTYAQILDGLPTDEVERDRWTGHSICVSHPLHDNHKTLCAGVHEHLRRLRDQFDARKVLKFDSKFELIHDFRATAPGSRAFNTRLVEMVAVAIHQIAAWIWNLDLSLHKHDGMSDFVPPKEEGVVFWKKFHGKPPATYFSHAWYKDYEQYPDGVADGVGYWAESRILGGVVVFDRRSQESDTIYFHSDRNMVTYRIYALLDTQKQQLLEFLLNDADSTSAPVPSPLPILADSNNRTRIDPEEPILETGIYRHAWDRKDLPLHPNCYDYRRRDVFDGLDWVTYEEWLESADRASDRNQRAWRAVIEKDEAERKEDNYGESSRL